MKTFEDLVKSKEFREKTLAYLGMMPDSILKHDRNDRPIDTVVGIKSGKVAAKVLKTLKVDSKHEGLFHTGGTSCRGKGGILSTFSQNICRFLVKFYTKEGDIVFDPFAGHNSRAESVWRTNRNYYGSDISKNFMEHNYKIRETLLSEKDDLLFSENTAEIVLREGDSRKVPWPDEFADFTITSPPYWDLEHYGDEPEQLGYGKGISAGEKGGVSYEKFLSVLKEVIVENYRVLKPGAFCVWNVNDFRKGGKFYDYHVDVIRLGREVGFVLHDMIIFDLGFNNFFIVRVVSRKVMAKRHEYGIVFRKPGGEFLKGMDYSTNMEEDHDPTIVVDEYGDDYIEEEVVVND